jgi:polysaccharide export outer membrane protein
MVSKTDKGIRKMKIEVPVCTRPTHLLVTLLVLSLGLGGCVADNGESAGLNTGDQTRVTNAISATASTGGKEDKLRLVPKLPDPPSAVDGSQHLIAENDVLEIDVFQVDALDRTVQVDSQGKIALPLIGEVDAAGQSARGLESEIKTRYGADYLQAPQISVFIKESFGQRVTVDGEVNKAGIYPTTHSSTLVGVMSQAGGLKDIADQSKVYVFRNYGNEKLVANYNLKKIRLGKLPDPKIFGGDVVVVFASSSRVAMRNLREVLGVAAGGVPFIP